MRKIQAKRASGKTGEPFESFSGNAILLCFSPVLNGMKPVLAKERKKHDRFNGTPEEEVSKRTLPDHLAPNLDIIIVSVISQ